MKFSKLVFRCFSCRAISFQKLQTGNVIKYVARPQTHGLLTRAAWNLPALIQWLNTQTHAQAHTFQSFSSGNCKSFCLHNSQVSQTFFHCVCNSRNRLLLSLVSSSSTSVMPNSFWKVSSQTLTASNDRKDSSARCQNIWNNENDSIVECLNTCIHTHRLFKGFLHDAFYCLSNITIINVGKIRGETRTEHYVFHDTRTRLDWVIKCLNARMDMHVRSMTLSSVLSNVSKPCYWPGHVSKRKHACILTSTGELLLSNFVLTSQTHKKLRARTWFLISLIADLIFFFSSYIFFSWSVPFGF